MSDQSPTLPYLQSRLAPLRYSDKNRVAADVLGLIANSNSLQIKIGQACSCSAGRHVQQQLRLISHSWCGFDV